MNIVERAKNILLSPKSEWPVIEAESSSVKSIYMEYLVLLALIPAVAGFIGMSLIGYSAFGVSVRTPIVSGIANMILGYALSLVTVFVVALIADALTANFGGQKNPLNAFKLIAFSMTPGLLGGIFSLIPALGVLGLLASLYGVYLLYLGVPTLMKVPEDKVAPYTVVLVICAIVVSVVIGAVVGIASSVGVH
ncbi:Yip1 family protein [Uliginosibacterium sp. H3]|uniref:Yip1 family protein n=1 Tax=Uliginosibacterium silvisoli TaxID=3114758 RepID=A0ABU6JZ26_9RHOO|nr:Yip1 family protein [Uliginosibacterium sp. H3]